MVDRRQWARSSVHGSLHTNAPEMAAMSDVLHPQLDLVLAVMAMFRVGSKDGWFWIFATVGLRRTVYFAGGPEYRTDAWSLFQA